MKLRLSTLLMIIAIMFFSFYYINYAPQVITPPPQPPMPLLPPPMEEGVTIVDEDMPIPIENFGVTFLDRDDSEDFEEYQYSGNVRPDNVMYKDDRTFNI